MKKIICLLLVLVMTLSLCACGSGEEAKGGDKAAGLQVGYARESITPNYPVGLGGYSDAETRISTGFADYIYTTCVAVASGEETILIYTVDLCGTSTAMNEKIRAKATERTGIPGEKIFIGFTHNHSAPGTGGSDAMDKYGKEFYEACGVAAEKAVADIAPAQLKAATKQVEGMVFVRHYKMDNGTYAGSNFGSFEGTIAGHAAPADDQMTVVQFDRGEDKQDVVLVNFQGHPDNAFEVGYNIISASWPGALREELAKQSGALVAYFSGASGNQAPDSKIASEGHGLDFKAYGQKLGQIANELLAEAQPVEGTDIKTTGTMLEVENDHSWDDQVEQANEVFDLWKSAGTAAGNALAKNYGFSSVYHARAIRTRASRPATDKLEVRAFSIGGIGFTTGTYEMFSTSALQVKEKSPFDLTFVITGNSSYIPDQAAFEYRSYESDTGFYVAGTG